MKYSLLSIIGTSHIARQSIEEVKTLIEKEKPAIVALELDKKRFEALFSRKTKTDYYAMIRQIGIRGFLFAVIGGWVQKKLGKYVKTEPGDEMKAAIKAARKVRADIALIDQDIAVTLSRFSQKLSWKEKLNFLADIFNALFFRKRSMRKYGVSKIDLSKVPSKQLINKLMKEVKHRYPNVYYVLVEERNRHMAKKLAKIIASNPKKKIFAVVGAGHEEGIKKLMNQIEVPGISYSFTTTL